MVFFFSSCFISYIMANFPFRDFFSHPRNLSFLPSTCSLLGGLTEQDTLFPESIQCFPRDFPCLEILYHFCKFQKLGSSGSFNLDVYNFLKTRGYVIPCIKKILSKKPGNKSNLPYQFLEVSLKLCFEINLIQWGSGIFQWIQEFSINQFYEVAIPVADSISVEKKGGSKLK